MQHAPLKTILNPGHGRNFIAPSPKSHAAVTCRRQHRLQFSGRRSRHAARPRPRQRQTTARHLISDVHLGTSGRADHLLDFLRCHESEYLYLVGDIVDGWQLKKSWYWKQSHNDVVQKVLRKARKGTKVIYVPGNHDEAARQYAGLDFGGIAIRQEAEHHTADGKRLLILHGDEFDGVIQYAKWLAYVGDSLYTLILS